MAKESKYAGVIGTVCIHIGLLLLLLFLTFSRLRQTEESGIEVMLGNTEASQGNYDPRTMVDVDILAQEMPSGMPESAPVDPFEQEMITQNEEETVVVPAKSEPVPRKPEAERPKTPEKSEAEKTEEARRAAEAKAEAERKAAAEAAARRVAGAFGRGSQMDDKGSSDSGQGIEGSVTGNSDAGGLSGNVGYGTFDLGGRSLGPGGLPRPVYNVQDEGKVVVSITVSPAGQVIATSINRQTNTVNPVLRKAAEDAAKKARFNQVQGVNNQTGTITYYFNLR